MPDATVAQGDPNGKGQKDKLETDLKGYNKLLNQLKESPDQDEAGEQYKKAIW